MTSQTIARPFPPAPRLELGPMQRAMVTIIGLGMTSLALLAMIRAGAGYAAAYRGVVDLAVVVHLGAVVPAIPLGAWLLLAAKGTPRHKALGKLWLVLMVTTALSAIFIRQINGGNFSFIHIFVPITLWSAWQAIATARAGKIAEHRAGLVRFYLLALAIPGLFAFTPGRLMAAWLFG